MRLCAGRCEMSLPVEHHRPGAGRDPPAEHADEGGLARAVRPDQRADLALVAGRNRHRATACSPPNSLRQPAGGQQRHGSHRQMRLRNSPPMPCGANSVSTDQHDADDQHVGGGEPAGDVDQVEHEQRADERAQHRARAAQQHPEQRQDRVLHGREACARHSRTASRRMRPPPPRSCPTRSPRPACARNTS